MRNLKHSVISVVLLGFLSPSLAQESVDVELNIAEQPLSVSLREVADSFDLTIAFYSESTDGLNGPALEGEYTSEAAFDSLLADTNLEYTFISDSSVAVRPIAAVADQGGDSDSKNSSPAPILMAQNTTSQGQTTVGGSNRAGDTTIVTGRVTDARTGANLRGAKVTIEETGKWTSTNDLGEFRFVGVEEGSLTLTVSFLGYAGQSVLVGVRGNRVAHDFVLRGGAEMEEIIVVGQRSARAIALNQERTAANVSTVISSDMLGDFNGDTLSEALRRAPGVAFLEDTVTGDGTNIVIRGLGPDFNQVTINGARIGAGDGIGRAADLGNILTDSVSRVTISKTLLASQDSTGTGGLVEVETFGPLDRSDRFLRLSGEGFRREDDFTDGYELSGVGSARFGRNSQFGIGGSVVYRDRSFSNISVLNDIEGIGQYLPLQEDGSPIPSLQAIDPRVPFPFVQGVDELYTRSADAIFREVESTDLSISATAQWQIENHTTLRLDLQHFETEQDSLDRTFGISSTSRYRLRQIDELGGEERYALVIENQRSSRPGINALISQTAGGRFDAKDTTQIFNLSGSSVINQWSFDYSGGQSRTDTETPARFSASLRPDNGTSSSIVIPREFLTDEALRNTAGGDVVSIFPVSNGTGAPVMPLFNESGLAFMNNATNWGSPIVNRNSFDGNNERWYADVSAKYNLSSNVEFEAGLFYERSIFEQNTTSFEQFDFAGTPLSALGLSLSDSPLNDVGYPASFQVLNNAATGNFFASLDSLVSGSSPVGAVTDISQNPLDNGIETEEEELSGYIQARLSGEKWEGIFGVRVSQVDVTATSVQANRVFDEFFVEDLSFTQAESGLVDGQGSNTAILPRLQVNYRPTENSIARFSYFKSVARPRVQFINGGDTTLTLYEAPFFGPLFDQKLLSVRLTSPDFEPSETDSFDLSFERYFGNVGVAKVGLFFKETSNFLQTSRTVDTISLVDLDLPDDSRFQDLTEDEVSITLAQSVENPEPGRIWGFELNLESQIPYLPDNLDGLGIYANYTYTDSDASVLANHTLSLFDDMGNFAGTEQLSFSVDVPYETQSSHTGTIGLTYQNHGFDASLFYSYQDRARNGLFFSSYGIDRFNQENDSLDLRIVYSKELGDRRYSIWFKGIDLLSDTTDPTTALLRGGENGIPEAVENASYIGGRMFTLGAALAF